MSSKNDPRPHYVLVWGPVWGCMAILFYLSSLSSPPAPPSVSDKVWHILGYAGLGLCAARAWSGGVASQITRDIAIKTLLLTVGYGITDEFHQRFVSERTPDVMDLMADAVGACVGLSAWWAWSIIWLRSAPRGTQRHDF